MRKDLDRYCYALSAAQANKFRLLPTANSQQLILIELVILLRNNINRHVIDIGDGYLENEMVVKRHDAAVTLFLRFLTNQKIDLSIFEALDVLFYIVVADE